MFNSRTALGGGSCFGQNTTQIHSPYTICIILGWEAKEPSILAKGQCGICFSQAPIGYLGTIYSCTNDKFQLFKCSQLFSLFFRLASSRDNFSSLIAENGPFSDTLKILSLNSRENCLLLSQLWRETRWVWVSYVEFHQVCIFMKFSLFVTCGYIYCFLSFSAGFTEKEPSK